MGTQSRPHVRFHARVRLRLYAAVAASLALHGLLILSGGALSGSSRLAGNAGIEEGPRQTWLQAHIAAAPLPRPEAPPRPERMMPTPPPVPEPIVEPAPVPLPLPEPAGEEGFGVLPANIPQTEEPVYFKATELDERAVPMAAIQPQPDVATRGEVRIRLEIYISAAGTVDKVEVISVTPEGTSTDFAVRALKNVRFIPAKIGDEAVASMKTIELNIAPE